jgi:DNA-binding transcriptional LysR family regulator
MTKPKLNQLEMLAAVADHGSFGAAAAALGCTQSRISHGIGELEAALGARLLERSRSGCTPTEAGLRVLATARQILRLADGLRNDAAGGTSLSGQVRIACFRSVATHVLPDLLHALTLKHPGIRVDVDDSHEERDAPARAVEDGQADIAVAQLPVAAALQAYDYVADDYVLVAPVSLRLDTPLRWAQLKQHNYLQLNCSGALAVLEQCRKAGYALQPSRLLATDSSIVAMIRKGLGLTILPHLAVHPAPAGVQLLPLPFPARRRLALVATPKLARTAVVEAVMQTLRDRKLLQSTEAFKDGVIGW